MTRRMRSAGDRGAPVGVDLARVDQPLGGREHRGQRDLGLHPAVVVLAAQLSVDVAGSRCRCRTPVANGRSRSSASSGPTWPVSASTELRPTSTRSNGPTWRIAAASALCRRERVGARERRVGDEHAVHLDVARDRPRDRLAQRVLGATADPSVSTVHEPPCSATSATPWATARRQYAFISRSRPSRRSRPSGPSSISSNAGICLTRTAMRMDVEPIRQRGFGRSLSTLSAPAAPAARGVPCRSAKPSSSTRRDGDRQAQRRRPGAHRRRRASRLSGRRNHARADRRERAGRRPTGARRAHRRPRASATSSCW